MLVEQEPGSGGLESAEGTIRNLAGYDVDRDRPTGRKYLRWRPISAQAEAGNVFYLRGQPWNKPYLDEMHNAEDGAAWPLDQVDASAGAFNYLALHSREPGDHGIS